MTEWKYANGVWYVMEDGEDTGVRLSNRVYGGGKEWKYSVDIHRTWIEPVPHPIRELPLDEIKAWVIGVWRTET